MGLLKKIGGFLTGTVGTIVSGVSGIIQGVVTPITGTAAAVINGIVPAVAGLANSKLAGGLSAAATSIGSGGSASLTPEQIAAINNSGGSTVHSTSGSADQDGYSIPLTGIKKFFNYYKTDSRDLYVLDEILARQFNWLKIAYHAGTVVSVGLLYVYGKKKRWFK